ncbi:MAG: TIGR01777 family oxidoreductase [Rickettsiales bacterium]
MNTVFTIMLVQVILGAFDNFYHHELTEKLPSKPSARHELTFHFIREMIYAVIFFGLAWWQWHGAWAIVLGALLITELVVTLCDFVIEDKTRLLPPFERVLHTILAISIGIFLAVFYPVLSGWYGNDTMMVSVNYGIWSWMFTAFAVGVLVWGIRNAIAVMKLHILKVPEWQRKPFKKGKNDNPKTYLITGATGFIGTALVRKFIEEGNDVIALSRDKEKVTYKFGPHVTAIDDLVSIKNSDKIDVVINLAGEALAGGLWTKARKQKFFDSRLNTTKNLVELIGRLKQKPELLLNGSAIGYYGNRGNETMTEESDSKTDFMASLCQQWEEETAQAEEYGLRVVRLRIGLVLDGNGGILTPMLLSTKFYGGMVMGSGQQYMSWIDLYDIIRLMQFIVSKPKITGAVNATAPNPATQKSFMKTLGKAVNRPVFMWASGFIFRFLLKDMADLFLNGQKVIPQKAGAAGFEFLYPELHQSFERIISGDKKEVSGIAQIYYNSECPVCDGEMTHYCKLKDQSGAPMDFYDITSNPDALKQYGLSKEDIQRRMYVLKANGEVANGVDASIEIWSHLSRYQIFAKLLRLPVLHFIGSFIYEGIIVPRLAYVNAKRTTKLPI